MAGRLAGKVAVISGAASGIGAGHVRVFAQEGAKVLAVDIQDEAGERVVAEVTSAGGDATFFHCDVTQESDWARAVREAQTRFGGINLLVNVAGAYRTEGVEEESLDGWNRMVAVNQTSVWLGMRAAVPAMRQAGGGAIVNISSLFGIIGSPGSIGYHGAKGASRVMTKVAALRYAPEGIRVNSVHPGIVDTPQIAFLTPEEKTAYVGLVPLGRAGEPEDIARGSLYLCSDDASYVTGSELVIDGGWLAQ
jgi:NAD(P)-dependent dehydrogenase (short-subunit alcohol dehydrogenase family)